MLAANGQRLCEVRCAAGSSNVSHAANFAKPPLCEVAAETPGKYLAGYCAKYRVFAKSTARIVQAASFYLIYTSKWPNLLTMSGLSANLLKLLKRFASKTRVFSKSHLRSLPAKLAPVLPSCKSAETAPNVLSACRSSHFDATGKGFMQAGNLYSVCP